MSTETVSNQNTGDWPEDWNISVDDGTSEPYITTDDITSGEISSGEIHIDTGWNELVNIPLQELFEKMIYFEDNYAVFLLEKGVVAFRVEQGAEEQNMSLSETFRATFEGEEIDLSGLPDRVRAKVSKKVL